MVAFLQLRERRWSRGLEMEAKRRGATAEDRLFAIFDVFDEWFRGDDFEACSFVNALLELGPQHAAGRAAAEHLANIRSILRELAEATRRSAAVRSHASSSTSTADGRQPRC